ncbi:MAG: hypothetical protein QM796_20065 [Chthoniobacteraceae bacterium]
MTVFATDGRLDDVVDIRHAQAIAGGGFAIDGEVQEIAAGCPLGEDAAGIGKAGERLLDLRGHFFDLPQIGPEDLDPRACCGSRW